EPWHVWLHYPELAREVDYLDVHILPYWAEQWSDAPTEYLTNTLGLLRQAYPNKNIIVTEVGWPSNGAERRSPATGMVKRAPPADHARNIRAMATWAKTKK